MPKRRTPNARRGAADALRTARAIARDLIPYLASLYRDRRTQDAGSTSVHGLRDLRQRFERALARLGVALEVVGAQRVPATGGLVIMWNQESHLDHVILGAATPRPFFSLYNNAVARVPLYGEHLRRSGHVHIDRRDEGQWRPAVASAAERVKRGECVVLSPEGTRSRDGVLLPMKRGAFILASASTRPIVCMTVIGGHRVMPRGRAIVRPGLIRVVFSEPIPTVGTSRVELAARVARTFTDLKDRHRLDPVGP